MIFEQIYLDCLSQASYLIGDDGRAVVVDPRRDVEVYLELATRHALTIEYAIATHVHADFVCGLAELAARCGATIAMGAAFDGELHCERLQDGQILTIGALRIEVLATPGHTPESICLLVHDRADPAAQPRLLTGDTLFLGDVGRPDLTGSSERDAAAMAGMLFDSLRQKILPLGDDTEVWPGHGAGSACGKNIDRARSSTLGIQRQRNRALSFSDRKRFIAELCAGLAPPPSYFAHAAGLNRTGPSLAQERPPLRRLDELESSTAIENGAVLVDVRPAPSYGAAHLPHALNVPLDGRFAEWCGRLIRPGRPIVLAAATAQDAQEAVVRLARVGHDLVIGWCEVDVARAVLELPQVEVGALAGVLETLQVVDVRSPGEFDAGHLPGARLAPLDRLPTDPGLLAGLDPLRTTAIVCGSGNRSSSAAHFLRRIGFVELRNVVGGMNAWRAAELPIEG